MHTVPFFTPSSAKWGTETPKFGGAGGNQWDRDMYIASSFRGLPCRGPEEEIRNFFTTQTALKYLLDEQKQKQTQKTGM